MDVEDDGAKRSPRRADHRGYEDIHARLGAEKHRGTETQKCREERGDGIRLLGYPLIEEQNNSDNYGTLGQVDEGVGVHHHMVEEELVLQPCAERHRRGPCRHMTIQMTLHVVFRV